MAQGPNQKSESLNKYISSTGICSRREADEFIKAKRVKINGEIAKGGNRVFPGDRVLLDGKTLKAKPKPIYIAFNKPVGIVCTTDENERDNIIDYIGYKERLFPIGRLDKDSEGLIFLTNDGDIVNKILRAGNRHDKEYIVKVHKPMNHAFIKDMMAGVPILDTVTKKCKVKKLNKVTFKITLIQGLNRQIRRMCEHFGYEVIELKRVRIMNVKLGKLPKGKWRRLQRKEVSEILRAVEGSSKLPQEQNYQDEPYEEPIKKEKKEQAGPRKEKKERGEKSGRKKSNRGSGKSGGRKSTAVKSGKRTGKKREEGKKKVGRKNNRRK